MATEIIKELMAIKDTLQGHQWTGNVMGPYVEDQIQQTAVSETWRNNRDFNNICKARQKAGNKIINQSRQGPHQDIHSQNVGIAEWTTSPGSAIWMAAYLVDMVSWTTSEEYAETCREREKDAKASRGRAMYDIL